MWPFSKKQTIATAGTLAGGTDYHTHILPGVDDGVGTMEEALHTLQACEATGIKKLWLTPHIMEDCHNTPAQLQERYEELRNKYNGSIELHLAAEYMIDNNFGDILDGGDLLPIGENRNHLLVETSYFTPPMHLHATLQRIKSRGYHPLLAHPERYLYMDREELRTLHEQGVRMQLNLISLAGGYGSTVRKNAEWLLKNNMYTLCGSDTHHINAIEIISNTRVSKAMEQKLGELLRKEI